MTSFDQNFIPHLFERAGTLNERVGYLHDRILHTMPTVHRIACAIYDAEQDQLKTFLNSTREGVAITSYDYKLADSPSLLLIAKSGEPRILNEIQNVIKSNSLHSIWLLKQGYNSSFTLPIYDNSLFIGFIFFDSLEHAAFTPVIQRDLSLHASLINMSISSELAAVRSIVASANLARDFAHLRDFETGTHLERMARYSRIIAKYIAPMHNLSDEFVEHVFLFAPLHDIGKIGIPDRILLKTGNLEPEERLIMESHVIKGCEIVSKILGNYALKHLPDTEVMTNIVRHHHEFLDGSGYPNGLKGNAIPIEARIITVADIYDALTSARPYKEAWSIEEACAELNTMVRAGKLDEDCVAAIENHSHEMVDIGKYYQDKAEFF
jgi:HD-GYP domain-containing protein (c-di-GMP phosphodiesterase class II)